MVGRKEAACKEVLGVRDEDAKEKYLQRNLQRKKREKCKGVYIKTRRKFINSLEGR